MKDGIATRATRAGGMIDDDRTIWRKSVVRILVVVERELLTLNGEIISSFGVSRR